MSRSTSPLGLNLTLLAGRLRQPAALRTLPDGATVATFDVRVTAADRSRAVVPVRWVDPPPAVLAWPADEPVVIVGRVERRFFRSGGATQTRTEVAATTGSRARQRAQVARALEVVRDELERVRAR